VTFENGVPLAPDEFSLRVLDLRMRDVSVEEAGAAGVSVVVSVKDSVAALYDGVADKKGLARGAFRLRKVVGGGGGVGGVGGGGGMGSCVCLCVCVYRTREGLLQYEYPTEFEINFVCVCVCMCVSVCMCVWGGGGGGGIFWLQKILFL